MIQARKMLAQAQLTGSPRFAKDDFLEASEYYDSAMIEWKNQNDIFILLRNYKKVIELAKKSSKSSENAIKKARENISSTKNILEIHIERLGERIKNFEEIFGSFPINKSHRNEIAKCKLLYAEGVHAFKNNNYGISQSKLDSAERIINHIFTHYQEKLIAYFSEYTKSKRP